MGERNSYKMLLTKPELCRLRHGFEDGFKWIVNRAWISLNWLRVGVPVVAFVNTVINPRVPLNVGIN
jgi:hypothetical protein